MISCSSKSEKLDRIIEAAKIEFAEKGYEKASTSQICKNAGVSKGLLFHHFASKKRLYIEVYEGILSEFVTDVSIPQYSDCKSFLDYFIKLSKEKLNHYIQNPYTYDIFLDARFNAPEEIKKEIKLITDKYVDMERYYSQTAFEKYEFRDGVDPKKAWEVLEAVVQLLERKNIPEILNKNKADRVEYIKKASKEMLEYLEIVFKGITG